MEELLQCPLKEFTEKIKKISDTKLLQELLWELEEKDAQSKDNQRGSLTFGDVINKDNAERSQMARESLAQIPEQILLRKKIYFCRESLLMAKNKVRQEVASAVPGDSLERFSFGIRRTPKAQELFTTKYQYRKANRINNAKVSVSLCGDLMWYDTPDLSIGEISDRFVLADLDVPVQNVNTNRKEVKLSDIQKAVVAEEKKRGKLQLIRIRIDDQDGGMQPVEYFMMMSQPDNLDWNSQEAQKFFVQTYLSTTYKELAAKASRTGEVLYAGRIVRKPEGKMEVRFYYDEIEGIEKASRVVGSTVGSDGREKRQRLSKMIAGIRDDLANIALREAFEDDSEGR